MVHTLGLDLDGVAADYVGGFRHHVARVTGRSLESLPFPSDWSFAKSGWCESTAEYLDLHAQAVNAGMYRTMPVMPGARESLQRIHDKGTRIVVMTSRFLPGTDPDQVMADTRHWIATHQIPVDDMQFIDDKRLCDADIYIEDAPHNINDLREAGRHVIVFDQPYNKGVVGSERVEDWGKGEGAIIRNRVINLSREYQLRGDGSPGSTPTKLVNKQNVATKLAVPAPKVAAASRCRGRNRNGLRCRRYGLCPAHPR